MVCRKLWASDIRELAEIHAARMSRKFKVKMKVNFCKEHDKWHIAHKQQNGATKKRKRRRARRLAIEAWENEGGSL